MTINVDYIFHFFWSELIGCLKPDWLCFGTVWLIFSKRVKHVTLPRLESWSDNGSDSGWPPNPLPMLGVRGRAFSAKVGLDHDGQLQLRGREPARGVTALESGGGPGQMWVKSKSPLMLRRSMTREDNAVDKSPRKATHVASRIFYRVLRRLQFKSVQCVSVCKWSHSSEEWQLKIINAYQMVWQSRVNWHY